MPSETLATCLDCGEGIRAAPKAPRDSLISHTCRRRRCEAPDCAVRQFPERMVRVESGNWYCPAHALELAARDLVSLYRAEGDADWTAIAEIIGEVLPVVLEKLERHGPTPSA